MTDDKPRIPANETVADFKRLMVDNLYYAHGQPIQTASALDAYTALSYSVRDHLIQRWRKTTDTRAAVKPRRVYYLSAEFLPGKQLEQNMLYTGTTELARGALAEFDLELERFLEIDPEPGLGNGGLGRLASCFLDSLATLDIPAVGYGIRYEFGIFKQTFQDGWQVEMPDEWLLNGNPWEFPQPDEMVAVGFGGHTETYADARGARRTRWIPAERVLGEPCTNLVPGYGTETVNSLRLWRARATQEFDFQLFDVGDYARAVEKKVFSENISKVLYPNDENPQGERLRLQQQYFFVACSLQDILRLFLYEHGDLRLLSQKVVIQLNDTHPVVAIPELMRLLVDEHELGWDEAWALTRSCMAYTCHTLLPEALEKWSVELFGAVLPRHLEIIYEINQRFLNDVRARFPQDDARVARMSLIQEGAQRRVRMAHLAAVGSFTVNGVAELQSKLLRERTLRDFAEMYPERFQNKTNGVTQRRFMRLSNPKLSELITSTIGDGWLTELEQLSRLEDHIEDAQFRSAWSAAKRANKERLADVLRTRTGIEIDCSALFDIMVKRLHEYKRQLLKALHIITLYRRAKANPAELVVPRAFVFGAKAAPGYRMAKLIIKLINNIAWVVNNDVTLEGRLKVVFPPNFNVSLAERIYPAADVSEQISLAGKEASGTGNMKFALNGALTVGTLDGANIEIRDLVGQENFFLFGLDVDSVIRLKEQGYDPRQHYDANAELREVLDSIARGDFSSGDSGLFRPIVDSLLEHDEYMVLADYADYIECSERAAGAYADSESWVRMSILNSSRCGFFSSDRSMRQYCEEIWKVGPVPPSGYM